MLKLIEVNLKINENKCAWVQTQTKLLGHIITENEIKMHLEKIKAVQEWKESSKVKHVQQFLGICGYYRKFIKDFSKIAQPLYTLRKDKKWEWNTECKKAFELLKAKLVSYPILRQPDFQKIFTL